MADPADFLPSQTDDAYKRATREVVDDAMRTDVLGPQVVRVLTDYKPVFDQVQAIICSSIKDSSAVREELIKVIDERGTTRKGVWVERGITFVVGATVSGVVGLVIAAATQ